MAMVNIKKLSLSEPNALYSDLEFAVRNGNIETTSKVERGNHILYLLAGFKVNNLNDAGLQEETVGRLLAALEAENINYALFPEDQRKGQLPLVLTQASRAYLENELPELINNSRVKWYVYELNANIDPDDNERAGSQIVVDEDESPVELSYRDIIPFFEANGEVAKMELDNSLYDEDVLDNETRSQIEELPEKEEDKYLDLDVDVKEHEFIESEEEPEEEKDDSDELSAEEKLAQMMNESEEQGSDDLFDDSIYDESNEEHLTTPEDLEHTDENSEDMSDDVENYSEGADIAQKIPESLQKILDSIKLPRFSEYKGSTLHPRSSEIMQSTIEDNNAQIASMEDEIKHDITTKYHEMMADAYEQTMRELDVESGDEFVRERYQSMLEKEEAIEDELQAQVNNHLEQLREDFFGAQLEDFKNEWLATARERFEKEFYSERVEIPTENYRLTLRPDADARKQVNRSDYYEWKDSVRDISIGTDQVKIVELLSKDIAGKLSEKKAEIKELQNKTLEIKRDLIAHESNAIAESKMREYVDNALSMDDRVALFKDERDNAYKKLSDAEAALAMEREALAKEKEALESTRKMDEELLQSKQEKLEQYKKDIENEAYTVTKVSQTTSLSDEEMDEAAGLKKGKKTGTIVGVTLGAVALATGLFFGSQALNDVDDSSKTANTTEEVSTESPTVTTDYASKKKGDTVRAYYGGGVQEFRFDHMDKDKGLIYLKDYNNDLFTIPMPESMTK